MESTKRGKLHLNVKIMVLERHELYGNRSDELKLEKVSIDGFGVNLTSPNLDILFASPNLGKQSEKFTSDFLYSVFVRYPDSGLVIVPSTIPGKVQGTQISYLVIDDINFSVEIGGSKVIVPVGFNHPKREQLFVGKVIDTLVLDFMTKSICDKEKYHCGNR